MKGSNGTTQIRSWSGSNVPENLTEADIMGGSKVVPDNDIYDSFDNLSSTQQTELFKNPVTQSFNDVPELQSAGVDLANDYNASIDADPVTTPTTDTATGDTGIDSVKNEDVAATESTSQCEDHPDSLACMETGENLEETDLGTLDIGTNFSSHSLNSNSTCPANPSHTLSSGQIISFDLSVVCSSLGFIKPVFITLCTLISLFIVVGSTKND